MNTPTHLIVAMAAFTHPNTPKRTNAAILGGLAPDLSLYGLVIYSLYINGNSPQYIFDIQYFSNEWQRIFAIDNSFFIWGFLILIGLILRFDWLWVFSASGFLHLCFDFPLHNNDARQHFWPITEWIFFSPFSYWDPNHYGHIVSGLEIIFTVILLYILWFRFNSRFAHYVIIITLLLQVSPYILYYFSPLLT